MKECISVLMAGCDYEYMHAMASSMAESDGAFVITIMNKQELENCFSRTRDAPDQRVDNVKDEILQVDSSKIFSTCILEGKTAGSEYREEDVDFDCHFEKELSIPAAPVGDYETEASCTADHPEDYISELSRFDVILVDAELLKIAEYLFPGRCIVLIDKTYSINFEEFIYLEEYIRAYSDNSLKTRGSYPFLEKYLPADFMASEIRLFFNHSHNNLKQSWSKSGNPALLIAVCSGTGGSGCTSIARELACCLSLKKQADTCIISMESFPENSQINLEQWENENSSGLYDGGRDGVGSDGGTGSLTRNHRESGSRISTPAAGGIYDINGFLYFLASGRRPQDSITLFTEKDRNGICNFKYPPGLNPLKNISESDMEMFVNSLEEEGVFQMIIADIGSDMGIGSQLLLENADKIVLVTRDEASSENRCRAWKRQTAHLYGDEIEKKTYIVKNMSRYPEQYSVRADAAIAGCRVFEGLGNPAAAGDSGGSSYMKTGTFSSDVNRIMEEMMGYA